MAVKDFSIIVMNLRRFYSMFFLILSETSFSFLNLCDLRGYSASLNLSALNYKNEDITIYLIGSLGY